MFEASSNRKFPPTIPKNTYDTVFVKPRPAPHALMVSRKNSRQPKIKTPVFTSGHTTAAATTAAYLLYFASSL